MKKEQNRVPYEVPALDWIAVEIEAGFTLSGGDPENWKDSGNNWEQDE